MQYSITTSTTDSISDGHRSFQQGLNSGKLLLLIAVFALFNSGYALSAKTAKPHNHPLIPASGNQITRAPKASRTTFLKAFGKLGIRFEPNRGQASRRVRFLSREPGYALYLTSTGAVLVLKGSKAPSLGQPSWAGLLAGSLFPGVSALIPSQAFSGTARIHASNRPATTPNLAESLSSAIVRLKLVNADPHATVAGIGKLPGKSNYLIGKDRQRWLTGVPSYAQVQYRDIYPGVELVYHSAPARPAQLEEDFVVEPGADPGSIKLNIQGADRVALNRHGDLLISVAGHELRFCKPLVYQEDAETGSVAPAAHVGKHVIIGRYQLGTDGNVSFKVAAYDKGKALIIDPVLSYSTYLGGTSTDAGFRVAVDPAGYTYVAGITSSTDFPLTAGTVDQTLGPTSCTTQVSSIYIPCVDAFVTKLSPDGKTLVYSTFLGGSRADGPMDMVVDRSGNVFLTGFTSSSDFPITSGTVQTTHQGESDAFVSELNSTGTALIYSTYIGGSKDDVATSIAPMPDFSGNVFITGFTFSSDFPATTGSAQPAEAGGSCTVNHTYFTQTFTCPDAFVAELNSTGTALMYATYLGGSSYDVATSITVDNNDESAYVTGATTSTDFPTTTGAYQSTNSGGSCGPSTATHPCVRAFVTKVNPTGTAFSFSTYFGGNGDTLGTAISVGSSNIAYVAGITNSTDLQTTGQSYAVGTCGTTTNSFDCPDAFVANFDSTGSFLIYMTYLGGTSYDLATDISIDGVGHAYVVGGTSSIDFPVTASAVQSSFGGGSCSTKINGTTFDFYCPNAFLTVLNGTGSPVFSSYLGGAGGDIAFGVAQASGNAYLAGTTISADFPVANAEQSGLAGGSDAFVAEISGVLTSAAAITLSPDSLNCGNYAVANPNPCPPITLSNSGGGTVNISDITILGNPSEFTQSNNCDGSIATGAICTINVTFTPRAAGLRTATLNVSDDAVNSPQTAVLQGQGQDFSLSAQSNTATVSPGGTATYDLALRPLAGFSDTIVLACSGAPAHSTCAMQPASITLDGTNQATAKLTVTTTGNAMTPPDGPGNFTPPSGDLPLAGWLALFSLLGLLTLAKFTRQANRARRLAQFATLALLVTLAAACGGGSTPPSNIITPTGTYTLTVKGTDGNLTHSVTVTLQVQ